MTYSEFYDELNIRIGDTDNFTFTTEEKQAALTDTYRDDVVGQITIDTSLTYASGDYQYPLPATMTAVKDIYLSPVSTDYPAPLDSSYYTVVDGNIEFINSTKNVITDGNTLYVRGWTPYTVDDSIPDTNTNLIGYILVATQLKLYRTLLNKKSFRFLRNDTSVSEIVASKREWERELMTYKNNIQRQFESA